MSTVIDETNWTKFLKDYSSRNEDRPTRLGVFERDNGNDYDFWIEDGLSLIALDAYPNKGKICVEILFEKYAHQIDSVARIVDIDGEAGDQGLDISDTKGRTTILRFEDWPARKEN